jgi:hypothetical protein
MNAKTEGALWKSLSCLCFAAINGLIFLLSGQVPAAEMAFFQNIFALLLLLLASQSLLRNSDGVRL